MGHAETPAEAPGRGRSTAVSQRRHQRAAVIRNESFARVETDLREDTHKAISETNERAAKSEQLAAEAIERAEKERTARTAMLSQLKPRTFTRLQMEEFVAEIKGTVLSIDLFTLT